MNRIFTLQKSKSTFFTCVLLASFCFTHFSYYCQSTWTAVATSAPDSSGSLMLLLSDGSVLCKTTNGGGDRVGNMWNKLTPNSNGSYINGTWSRVAPMKDTRLYFSSQVLKNGKVYVAGGEYGSGMYDEELYDPVTNSWTQLPGTNNYFGDACSVMLDDGKVMQAALTSFNKVIVYNPSTNTFTNGPNTLAGHNESTWIKLPDNSVLFVDIGSTSSERYIPSLNQWVTDASTPSNLYDPYGFETGPAFLLPDGRAMFLGSLGNTAFYTPSGNNSPGSWTSGPTIPANNGAPDVAGSMLPDGKIIFSAGPKPVATGSVFLSPTYYYEFDYLSNSFASLPAPGGGTSILDTAFNGTMLNLPDGNVMLSRQYKKDYYIYKPNGTPLAAGKPTITAVTQKPCTNTFTLTGLLFNGICEGSCYGDDWQMNTNFPIVRLTSGANVYYARTYNWNHTGVMTGALPDTTLFDLPPGLPNGTYSLSVIANGNASNPITFTFSPFPSLVSPLTAPDICSGNNFSYAAVCNMTNSTAMWTRAAVPGISNAAVTVPQSLNPNETLVNTTNLSKTVVYTYTVTNNTCVTNFSVSVVVHPTDVISFTGGNSVCRNASLTLKANGISTFTWSTGAFTNTVLLSPLATSVYTVSGVSPNGCLSSKEITLTVKPSPTISVSGSTLICMGESTTLTASSDAGNYSWNTGETTNTAVITPVANHTYSVNTSFPNGCYARAAITISVMGCQGIEENRTSGPSLLVYPNPSQQKIIMTFTSTGEGDYFYFIYDVFGKSVLNDSGHFVNGLNEKTINLSGLSSGAYKLVLTKGRERITSTVIKE